tara:strand:+ start:876 stop:1301 length:426 start_codon:yes stop_codon:yes gene_type:complete
LGFKAIEMTKAIITKTSDEKILIKRYWSNGQKKYEGSYNEMLNELVDEKNGTKITLKNYETRDKNKDGKCIWWFENGQKESEMNFKRGKLDGMGTSWHNNGKIAIKGNYKDGKAEGKWIAWYGNGQKKYEEDRTDIKAKER